MSLKLLSAGFAGSLLLSSCALYMPTVPSTPLLSKGQAQVAAGVRGVTALEASAAWAPTNHLLLSAESALYTASSSSTDSKGQTTSYHDYHRQLSLGAGYYRAAPSGWYLAALGGVGVARTAQYDPDLNIFFGVPDKGSAFQATYLRYYAQAYAAWAASQRVAAGFSLRTVYTAYTHLDRSGQPFNPNTHVFFEPTLFLKTGSGPLQVQTSFGLSLPLQTNADAPAGNRTSPITPLIGVALIFRPDLLKRKQP